MDTTVNSQERLKDKKKTLIRAIGSAASAAVVLGIATCLSHHEHSVAAPIPTAEVVVLDNNGAGFAATKLSVASVEGSYRMPANVKPEMACHDFAVHEPEVLTVERYTAESNDELRALSDEIAQELQEQAKEAETYDELYDVIRNIYQNVGVPVIFDDYDERLVQTTTQRPKEFQAADRSAVINHIDQIKNLPKELLGLIETLVVENTGSDVVPGYDRTGKLIMAGGWASYGEMIMPLRGLGTRAYIHELGHVTQYKVCGNDSSSIDILFKDNMAAVNANTYDKWQAESLVTINKKKNNPNYSTAFESNQELRSMGILSKYAMRDAGEFFAETFVEILQRGRRYTRTDVTKEEAVSLQVVEGIVNNGLSFDFSAYLDRRSMQINSIFVDEIGSKALSNLSVSSNKISHDNVTMTPVAKISEDGKESYIFAKKKDDTISLDIDFPAAMPEADREKIINATTAGMSAHFEDTYSLRARPENLEVNKTEYHNRTSLRLDNNRLKTS